MHLVDILDEARALVPVAARGRLLAAMRPYAELQPELALERHLGGAPDRVDLVVRLFPADRDTLLRASPRAGLSGPVAAFLEGWRDDPGLAALPFVELEIDLDGDAPREPWVGPCIEPLLAHGTSAIATAHRDLAPTGWPSFALARAVLARLGATDEAWHRRLADVFAALPAGGCINHLTWLGARPARAGDSAIHCIASLPSTHALAFLQAVGWRGDRDALARLLRRHLPHATRVDLDLDLDLDGAAAGTAFYAGFTAPRPTDGALARLLDGLRADGLVPEESAAAIASWLGSLTVRERWILTVKVALREHGECAAKLYLEVTRR